MSTRTMRMAAAALLCGLAAAPALAQTAPAPQPRRFALTVGSGESQMVIYVDAMMMPRTATTASPRGPMGPLEAVTIGTGEGAMTVYRDASGRMAMTQTALMGAPASIGPRRAVTIGSGSNEMVVYIEEVQMTPSR